LPQITERYQYTTLSEEELKQYDETLATMAEYIRQKAGRNPQRRDPLGIFQAQLQLRLICNHETFQKPFTERRQREKKDECKGFLYSLGENAEITCSVCGIPIPVCDVLGSSKAYRHGCGRKFCQERLSQSWEEFSAQGDEMEAPSPLCHVKVGSEPRAHDQELTNGTEGYFNRAGFSSKIETLLTGLEANSMDTKRSKSSGPE